MFNFLHSNWNTCFMSYRKELIYSCYHLTTVRCRLTHEYANEPILSFFAPLLSFLFSNLPEPKAQVRFSDYILSVLSSACL